MEIYYVAFVAIVLAGTIPFVVDVVRKAKKRPARPQPRSAVSTPPPVQMQAVLTSEPQQRFLAGMLQAALNNEVLNRRELQALLELLMERGMSREEARLLYQSNAWRREPFPNSPAPEFNSLLPSSAMDPTENPPPQESVPTTAPDIQPPPTLRDGQTMQLAVQPRRHTGSVVGGMVLGFITGLFGVLGIWVRRRFGWKGPKSDDLFFGSWFGMLAAFALALGIYFVATAASGSPTGSTRTVPATATPQQQLLTADEAVNIAMKELFSAPGAPTDQPWWGRCERPGRYNAADRKWVITCAFRHEQADLTPFWSTIVIVDDTTGQLVR